MKNLDNLSLEQIDNLIRQKRRAEQAAKQAEINKPSKFESFGRGVVSAIPGANKLMGAIGAGVARTARSDLFEEPYAQTYERGRNLAAQKQEEAFKQNPATSIAGSLLGGATLPFPAKTIKGAAGLGAGYGAAYSAGNVNEGIPGTIEANDIAAALYGAPFGAALGAAGQYAFGRTRNVNPQSVENIGIAEELGLPLTRGEATRNPAELYKQEAGKKGQFGESNQNKITAFEENRANEFRNKAEDIRNQIAGKEFAERGTATGEAISNIGERALQERKAYSDLYNEAKKNIAKIDTEDLKEFPKLVAKDFEENVLTAENAGKAYSELNSLNSIVQKPQIDLKQLEAWKQGLNRSIRETTQGGQEEFALKQLSNKFDGYLDGIIEKALVEGDVNALDQFKNARGLAKEWFEKYGAKSNDEFGKKFIEDIVDNARFSREPFSNEMLVNKIFGASELGFKPQSAAIVKEIKKLGTESDFSNIKLEAANKIISPLLKDNPNIATYNNNLKRLLDNNPTLAKELFTKEDIKTLQDLGKYGKLAFTREKSLTNPSGTAGEVIDYLVGSKGKFFKSLGKKIEIDQAKITDAIRKGEITSKEIPAAVKASIIGGSNIINKINDQRQRLDALDINELDKIIEKKQNKNLNKTIEKIGQVESGNNYNAKNPNSSAFGKYQFTKDTWRDLVKNNPDLNLKLSDIKDPKAQEKAIRKFTNENVKNLKEVLGRQPSEGEIYAAHFLGLNGAKKLIEAKPTEIAAKLFPKAAKANKSIFFDNKKPRTVKQVYQVLDAKLKAI